MCMWFYSMQLVTSLQYVEYKGVETCLMCHKKHGVSVVGCAGGQRSLRCEGREGALVEGAKTVIDGSLL